MGLGTRWCVLCERWGRLLAACEGEEGRGPGAQGSSYATELMQCRQAVEAAPEKWKVQLGAIRKLAGTFKKRKAWPNQEPCDVHAFAAICEILVSMALLPHSSSDLQHAAVSGLRVLSAGQRSVVEEIVLRHIGYLLRSDPSAPGEWVWWYSHQGMRELVRKQAAEQEEHTRWLKHHFEAMDLLFQSWSLGQSCMEQLAGFVLAHIRDLFGVYAPICASTATTASTTAGGRSQPATAAIAGVGDHGGEKAAYLVEGLAKVLSRLQSTIRAIISHVPMDSSEDGSHHKHSTCGNTDNHSDTTASTASPPPPPSKRRQQGASAAHDTAVPVVDTLQHIMQHVSHLLLSTAGPSKVQHGAALACAHLLALDVPHSPGNSTNVPHDHQQTDTQTQGVAACGDSGDVKPVAISLSAFGQVLQSWAVRPMQFNDNSDRRHHGGACDTGANGATHRARGDLASEASQTTSVQAAEGYGPLQHMSLFAVLALWRAIVQTEACVTLLQERHPSILHPVGFSVVASVGIDSSDLQLRRFAVECLDAWLKAALKAMRSCAGEDGRHNPWSLPFSDVVNRCASVVLHHVDDPVDKTRHQVRDLLESLVAFSDATQTQEAQRQLHQYLLLELQRLPWSARGKYPCLQQLSRSIGVDAVLAAWPDLASRLLTAMAKEATAKPANTLFVDLAIRHRDECSAAVLHTRRTHVSSSTHATPSQTPQSPFEAWAQQWLQPAVAALASGSDFLRKTLLELTIPKLFAVDRQCVLFAVHLLRKPATHSASALLALTALLRHSRAAGLLTQIPITWTPTAHAPGAGGVSVFTDPVPVGAGTPLQGLGPVVSERPESDRHGDVDDDDSIDNGDEDGAGTSTGEVGAAVDDSDGDEHPALVHVGLVKAALVHESAEIRSNMLGFLCHARKTKCVPSAFELRAVQFFLTWNKLVSSAERKGIERSLRKLFARLHTVFGSSKYKAATSHDTDKEAVSTACSTFLQWLWHFAFQLLAAHEPFQTRALGQTVLEQIMLALPPTILCHVLSRPAHAVTRATERDTGKHPDWTGFPLSCQEQRVLALSLLDRYEINRLGAFNLLARLGVAPLDLTGCFGHGMRGKAGGDGGYSADEQAEPDLPRSSTAAVHWVQRHTARVNHINTHFCALVQTLSYARLLHTPPRAFTRIDKMFGSLLAGDRTASGDFGCLDPPCPSMSQDERLVAAQTFVRSCVSSTTSTVVQRAGHVLWLLQQLRAKVDRCTPTSVVPLHGTMEALRHLLIIEPFVDAPADARGGGGKSKAGKKGTMSKKGRRGEAAGSGVQEEGGGAGDAAGMDAQEQHRLWSALMLIVWHEMKRVVDCTMPTIASSAPEGYAGEAGGDERGSPDLSAGSSEAVDQDMDAKMHLVCCWRAMREMAFVTALLVLRFPYATTSKQVSPLHLTWTDALHMGKDLYTHLLQSRHRGVVEVMSSSFQAICSRLWSQFPAELNSWLDDAVGAIRGADRDSITRRSAGFPLLVLSLLRSAPGGRRSRLVETCLQQLLAIARRQTSDNEETLRHSQQHQQQEQQQPEQGRDGDGDDDMHVVGHRRNAAVVHAYNVIRAIMRDESVSKHCTDKVDETYALAFDGFVAPAFAVRNAAMMLFSSLQTRLFGSSSSSTTTTPNTGATNASGLLASSSTAAAATTPLRSASSPAPAPSSASGDRVLTLRSLFKSHPGLADIVLTTLGTPPSSSNTHNKKAYLALVFLSGLDNRAAVPDGDATCEAARLALRMARLLRVWAACADVRVRRLAARAVTAVVPFTLVDRAFMALVADADAALGVRREEASSGDATTRMTTTTTTATTTTAAAQSHGPDLGVDEAEQREPPPTWNAHHGRLLQLCALVGTHASHLDAVSACHRCLPAAWTEGFLSSATASAIKASTVGAASNATPATSTKTRRAPWVVQAAYWQLVSALLAELNRRCEGRDVLYCNESVRRLQGIYEAVVRVHTWATAQVKALTERQHTPTAVAVLRGEPGRARFKTAVTRALHEARSVFFGAMQAVGAQRENAATGSDGERPGSSSEPVEIGEEEGVSDAAETALFRAVLQDPDMAQGALDFYSSGRGELPSPLFAAAAQTLLSHSSRGSGGAGGRRRQGAPVCDEVCGPDATTALLACLQKPLVGAKRTGRACRITDTRALGDALVAGHRLVSSSLDDVRLGAVALCGHAARQLCLQRRFTRDHTGLYLGALSSFAGDIPDTNAAIAVLEGLSALPAVLQWWERSAAAQRTEMASRQLLSGVALLLQVLFHDEPAVATRAASLVSTCWLVCKDGNGGTERSSGGKAENAGDSRQEGAADPSDGHRLNALASASRLLVLCDERLSISGAVLPSLYLTRTLATYVQEESVASGLRDLLRTAATQEAARTPGRTDQEEGREVRLGSGVQGEGGAAYGMVFLHNEALPLYPVVDVLALGLRAADVSNDTHTHHMRSLARAFAVLPARHSRPGGVRTSGAGQQGQQGQQGQEQEGEQDQAPANDGQGSEIMQDTKLTEEAQPVWGYIAAGTDSPLDVVREMDVDRVDEMCTGARHWPIMRLCSHILRDMLEQFQK